MSDTKLATCAPCRSDLGAGDCWECHEVRTKLELAGFLNAPIYNRLQWKASEDRLLRERTLAATKEELSKEAGA